MSECTGKGKAKFILNFSTPCNMNYHRLLNNEINSYTYTQEQLLRFSEYIKFVIQNNSSLGNRTKVVIVTSTALNEIDNLMYFAKEIKDSINFFYLSVNESTKKEDIDKIYSLWSILGSKLQLDIFYNLGLDDNLDKESMNSFYYLFKVLIARGLGYNCTIKVNPSNVHKLVNSFNEVLELHKLYKNIKYHICLDATSKDDEEYDKNVVESSLKTISDYLDGDPDFGKYFSYVPSNIFRKNIEETMMNGVLLVMTEHGNIYPGYDVQFMTDKAKNEFILGNISEDFSILENKRKKLLENFKNIIVDKTSNSVFKSIPWEDDDYVYSIKPSEQVKEMHELLTKYLFEKTFIYQTQD